MSFACDAWVFESECALMLGRGPGSREDVEVVHVVAPRSTQAQVTHSPRLRIAVFAMALGLQSQSFKGPVGWQSQSQAVPQPS